MSFDLSAHEASRRSNTHILLALAAILLVLLFGCSSDGGHVSDGLVVDEVSNNGIETGVLPLVVGTEGFVIESTATGHRHQLWVGFPLSYDQGAGTRYPVVYLNDGDDSFLSTLNTTRALARTGDLEEVIVVGIGYPQGENHRRLDYTPSKATRDETFIALGVTETESGGASQYHEFLVKELVPMINNEYLTQPKRNLLFGHSLGGLFTMYEIAQPDTPFSMFIASSPSIWWEAEEVLSLDRSSASQATVYVSAGEFEQIPGEFIDLFPEEVIAIDAATQMIDNAITAYDTLQGEGIETYGHIEEAGVHINVSATALDRGLRTLLEGTNQQIIRDRSSQPLIWE